jgi:uncharacterized protein
VRFQIFSDIHSDQRALERNLAVEADYYIAAGDLVSWARGLDRMGEIMQPKADRVLVIPGNHESEADIAAFCAKYGFTNLHRQSRQFGSWHIAGLGYSSPTPFNTPGEYTEEEIACHLEPFAALSPLILVCHCPPKPSMLDRTRDGQHHFGSAAIATFLAAHQPRYFFCGHIHEAEGVIEKLGETCTGVNVGKAGYLLDLAKL